MNLKLSIHIAFWGCVLASLTELIALIVYLFEIPPAKPMVFMGSLAFTAFYGVLAAFFFSLQRSHLLALPPQPAPSIPPKETPKEPKVVAVVPKEEPAPVPKSHGDTDPGLGRVCPNCERWVNAVNKTCRYCGYDFAKTKGTSNKGSREPN